MATARCVQILCVSGLSQGHSSAVEINCKRGRRLQRRSSSRLSSTRSARCECAFTFYVYVCMYAMGKNRTLQLIARFDLGRIEYELPR